MDDISQPISPQTQSSSDSVQQPRQWMTFWLIVGAAFVFALIVSYGILFIDFGSFSDSSSVSLGGDDSIYLFLASCTVGGDLSCKVLEMTPRSAKLVIVNTAGKTVQISNIKSLSVNAALCSDLTVVAQNQVLTSLSELSIQLYCNAPFAETGEILLQGNIDNSLFELSSLVVRQR